MMEILPTGKLHSDYLEKLLGKIDIRDHRVIVGPGIGEDAAVLTPDNDYLIVKSDPITFVTDRIGWYVVNINANDIAAMGGTPHWFLVTMLLPEGETTPISIEKIMEDLKKSCSNLGISLIGGHTEVTPHLKHPILAGTMLGEAKKGELITNGTIGEGDLLFMTKGVAIEATSIIAREKKAQVIEAFGEDFYQRCIMYLEDPGISVVEDAQRARKAARITGMHDPTEGGLLTGAYEMAHGSSLGLELYIENIPVFEETKKLCNFYKISPYGSIASGALLISVAEEEQEKLEKAFDNHLHGIPALSLIGRFTKRGAPIYVVEKGQRHAIHPSGKDEVTKII